MANFGPQSERLTRSSKKKARKIIDDRLGPVKRA
jgi:hypothetical protein